MPAPPPAPAPGEPLRAGHVLAALAERLPRDAILVEETPSSRPELHARIPATAPLGFVSAMGLLGFGLPAAIGLRMARPDRPVLAVLGDGAVALPDPSRCGARPATAPACCSSCSSTAATRSWTGSRSAAARSGPWPQLDSIDIGAMARAQGCEAVRVEDHGELLERLDELLPGLAERETPLVLEVVVAQDPTFDG